MVEGRIETEFILDERTFLRAAGDPDRSRARKLRKLSDHRPHRPRSRRDSDCLSLLRLADEFQPAPGCETGHAQDAEDSRDRGTMGVD
ncbi:hypothetical protein D3C80_803310 [compost metagenome]